MKIFDKVRTKAPSHSGLDLSHEVKMSGNFGKLYPILLQEVVPGDTFSGRSEVLVRLAPTIAPIMHRIDCFIHYFNVPNRIVFDEWEEFITGGDDGTASPNIPTFNFESAVKNGKGTLADYFGIPTYDGGGPALSPLVVSQLPFRAYHEIWNEYYRDQNLQEKIDITYPTFIAENYQPSIRAYEKDYFTSALPYPQKGPAVSLPITSTFTPDYLPISIVKQTGGELDMPANDNIKISTTPGNLAGTSDELNYSEAQLRNLEATQTATSTNLTIEELRRASRLQEWLEIAARAGSRYKELIKSMFGVNTGDARLDRPEYLGGGRIPVTISEVLNTTGIGSAGSEPGEQGAPQGTMAGHGIAVGTNATFNCKAKEHGHILGILSILPKTGYQQGAHRLWSRRDKFDFYWPKFANLGEQAVLNQEIYKDFNTSVDNEETFGYQQRYAEYKYNQNRVAGDFRDDLDFWHLSRKFTSLPPLNSDFIECDNADLQRIFASTDPDIDKFYIQIYNQVRAKRPMPYFADPTL